MNHKRSTKRPSVEFPASHDERSLHIGTYCECSFALQKVYDSSLVGERNVHGAVAVQVDAAAVLECHQQLSAYACMVISHGDGDPLHQLIRCKPADDKDEAGGDRRSEEHTSELQSPKDL